MMIEKRRFVVGIDPDHERSGVALIDTKDKRIVSMQSMEFPDLIDRLVNMKEENYDFLVVVEASWLHKANWHVDFGEGMRISARKGYDVGCNHETGRKIVEMLRHHGIEVVERQPLPKAWSGKDRKITHEELAYFAPVPKSRTNPEERDAALLAWNHAALPVRVKPRTS